MFCCSNKVKKQGEHRKPEHTHKPRKEKTLNQPIVMQPRDNIQPVVQVVLFNYQTLHLLVLQVI